VQKRLLLKCVWAKRGARSEGLRGTQRLTKVIKGNTSGPTRKPAALGQPLVPFGATAVHGLLIRAVAPLLSMAVQERKLQTA
jgi:hypothetical protein